MYYNIKINNNEFNYLLLFNLLKKLNQKFLNYLSKIINILI